MYCINCGSNLEPNMKFCPKCGKMIANTSGSETQTGARYFADGDLTGRRFQRLDFADRDLPGRRFQRLDFADGDIPSRRFQRLDFADRNVSKRV